MIAKLRSPLLTALLVLFGIAIFAHPTEAVSEAAPNTLAAPESFSSIADVGQRSAAYFTELGKVLLHPRCLNCHPSGDHPHQLFGHSPVEPQRDQGRAEGGKIEPGEADPRHPP
jgi:hypothetical protein